MTGQKYSAAPAVSAFYDRLADDYDSMTGLVQRFPRETPFFKGLVEKHNIAAALDAGCGTGFHSLLLAQLGVRMTAVDVSEEMLVRLRGHARDMGLDIASERSDFGGLAQVVKSPLDAVFCMGNTLPHLMSSEGIGSALANFAALLRPGGILVVQLLNYERILAAKERVQNVKESHDVIFVRFYDFDETAARIHFNILRLERTKNGIEPALITVPLLPVTSTDIVRLLQENGYGGITLYGSIAMEPFDPAVSRDLVILGAHP